MKFKNIKYLGISFGVLFTVLSCSEEFLYVDPKGLDLVGNYYKDENQAYSGLVAAYDNIGKQSRGFENMICMLNAGSDDFLLVVVILVKFI